MKQQVVVGAMAVAAGALLGSVVTFFLGRRKLKECETREADLTRGVNILGKAVIELRQEATHGSRIAHRESHSSEMYLS